MGYRGVLFTFLLLFGVSAAFLGRPSPSATRDSTFTSSLAMGLVNTIKRAVRNFIDVRRICEEVIIYSSSKLMNFDDFVFLSDSNINYD